MSMNWSASVEATSFNVPQFPQESGDTYELALAGRSNVGKSTLVNALLGEKLAYVGSSPGKTRSVNFYSVAARERDGKSLAFRVVDLPGYGYAGGSKSARKEWSKLTSSYIETRASLCLVCHLVDFRHGLLPNDRELQDWLSERGKPIMTLFTKSDKIAKNKRRALLQQYVTSGLKSFDVPILTSGEERVDGELLGVGELREFLVKYINGIKGEGGTLNG
ncbi:putative GTP-binding protein EngB [Synergistales bacterium]|nr:putative GTP-binding protein EngB [Synergistales bacterium]